MSKPKVVSIFSGAGGLDIGFRKAGFKIIFSSDNWETAVKTLKQNKERGQEITCQDISEIDFKELKFKHKKIDVLIGGPPCPPFSKSRFYRENLPRSLDDDTATHTLNYYFNAVEILEPETFVFENVPGFVYKTHKEAKEFFDGKLQELGYDLVFDRVINCANLNPESFEQKIFGVEKNNGEVIKGFLEDSNGGTILFDQIEDMPISTQGKIIGFLEEQKFTRLGGIKSVKTDVRIISSTKTDLENSIKLNLFREDLFFKLNVIPINVPTLDERKDDIEDLINIFIDDYSKQNNFKKKVFSSECIEFFKSINLTGNVRQLRNLIQWILILLAESKLTKIEINHIPDEIKSQFNKKTDQAFFRELPMKDAREIFEKNYIEQFLNKYDFNINKVSNIIGMERTALYRKIKNLNINLSKK